VDDLAVPLRSRGQGEVREMRRLEGKGLEGKEGRGAHRRYRNRAGMLADQRSSGEILVRAGGVSG
jgi:hypothetical protein